MSTGKRTVGPTGIISPRPSDSLQVNKLEPQEAGPGGQANPETPGPGSGVQGTPPGQPGRGEAYGRVRPTPSPKKT